MFELDWEEAMTHGVKVVDALHVGAARVANCRYLFTTESANKPMFRTSSIKVIKAYLS
jgi:hypothetical protein